MFPVRFVIACENGHIEDFPWRSYVHDGASQCRSPLTLREAGRSGSIGDVIVRCETHGPRSMRDAFEPSRRAKLFSTCAGSRPWLPNSPFDPNPCSAEVRTILRGASNLYFPVVRSALSIPPWSDRVQEAVAAREKDLVKVDSVEALIAAFKYVNFEDLERWSPEEVWAAIQKRRGLVQTTIQDLLLPEWEALRQATGGDHGEFQTHIGQIPATGASWIAKVVVVRRLKEVRAIQAFTRIDSWADLDSGGGIDQRRLAPLTKDEPTWLPALLTRGEGIFFELHEGRLKTWEQSSAVVLAHAQLSRAHDDWRKVRKLVPAPAPPARYVLLHTLGHLLMRQVNLECGYSTSALRERIYASAEGHFPMAGLLVYTSTADSEGSLGGLIDLARPHILGPILDSAIADAMLCSSDPLCADARPGDRGAMNGAACHSCLLLPETSCERNNRFLDRAFVVSILGELGSEFLKLMPLK